MYRWFKFKETLSEYKDIKDIIENPEKRTAEYEIKYEEIIDIIEKAIQDINLANVEEFYSIAFST